MRVDTAIITAAGLGTRLRPITNILPKVLMPLGPIPAIHYVVKEAVEADIHNIYLVIGKHGDLIKLYFQSLKDPWTKRIIYIKQTNPRGLGDAILCAKHYIKNKPFIVMFGDSLFLKTNPSKRLITHFKTYPHSILGVQPVSIQQANRRGMIQFKRIQGARFGVTHVIEKPSPKETPSNLSLIGRFIFSSALFPALKKVTPDKSGELQLTPAINTLLKSEPVFALKILERRLDIGNVEDYTHAWKIYSSLRFPTKMLL